MTSKRHRNITCYQKRIIDSAFPQVNYQICMFARLKKAVKVVKILSLVDTLGNVLEHKNEQLNLSLW